MSKKVILFLSCHTSGFESCVLGSFFCNYLCKFIKLFYLVHLLSPLLLYLTVIVHILDLIKIIYSLCHELGYLLIKDALVYLVDPVCKMSALGSDILTVKASCEHSNLRMGDACGTA